MIFPHADEVFLALCPVMVVKAQSDKMDKKRRWIESRRRGLFGISTAVIFAVMSRLIANRLRHQFDPQGKEKNAETLHMSVVSEIVRP
jgi:hypothetical protein